MFDLLVASMPLLVADGRDVPLLVCHLIRTHVCPPCPSLRTCKSEMIAEDSGARNPSIEDNVSVSRGKTSPGLPRLVIDACTRDTSAVSYLWTQGSILNTPSKDEHR